VGISYHPLRIAFEGVSHFRMTPNRRVEELFPPLVVPGIAPVSVEPIAFGREPVLQLDHLGVPLIRRRFDQGPDG
jgi:hypothetical protein